MALTARLIAERRLTALMVTHSMSQALAWLAQPQIDSIDGGVRITRHIRNVPASPYQEAVGGLTHRSTAGPSTTSSCPPRC